MGRKGCGVIGSNKYMHSVYESMIAIAFDVEGIGTSTTRLDPC